MKLSENFQVFLLTHLAVLINVLAEHMIYADDTSFMAFLRVFNRMI